MRKILLLTILLMVFVVNLDITKAQTETIIIQEPGTGNLGDTFVAADNADVNFGYSNTIGVSATSAFMKTYIIFNLASIPTNVIINNATLNLYCYASSGDAALFANLYHIFDHTWQGLTENTLTWNNQFCPGSGCNSTIEDRLNDIGMNQWYTFDVSSAVSQEYYNGDSDVSFFLTASDSPSKSISWWSKEYEGPTGHRPYLQITYTFLPTTTSTTTIPFNYTEFMELKEKVESNTQRIVDLETVVDWILGQIDSIWVILNQPRILTPANSTYPYEIIVLDATGTDVDTWWYKLNDGEETVFTSPVNITGIEGTNKLIVFANYTDGSIHSDTVYFTVHPGDLLPNNVVDIFDIVYMAGRYGDRY